MEKKEFVDFAEEVFNKEAERKSINQEIKEAKVSFAEKHGIEKQTIEDLLKDYKKFLKDKATFTVIDKERTEIIEKVCFDTVATTTEVAE